MGKDSGGGKTKTTTTSEPWSGVQPYLTDAYSQASSLYGAGAPAYYPFETVAPMSGYTEGGYDTLFNRGVNGSAVGESAKNMTTNTLNGQYLNSNQYLGGAIDAAQRPLIENYNNNIAPGIDSMFSAAGRYASDPESAHAQAAQQAGTDLTRNLGDISSQMSYQNYGDERQRMMQAGALAPSLANMDYQDINAMQQAGQGIDQYNQGLINANIDEYNYGNNAQWNYLNDYIGLLNGAVGGSTASTAKQTGSTGGGVGGVLGGAVSGAGVGSIFGPWGTALGAGIGGLASLF